MSSLWKRLLGRESQANPLNAGALSLRLEPENVGTVTVEPTPQMTAEKDVRSAIQVFGLDLLRQECAARPKENAFISPLSVYLALAMAENGAGGDTKQAMRRVLRIPADAETLKRNAEAKQLMEALQKQEGIELAIGNALWIDGQMALAPEFVGLCAEYFDALVRSLDMKNPASAKIINDWVSEKTRGKIGGIVSAEATQDTTLADYQRRVFQGQVSDSLSRGGNRAEAVPSCQWAGKAGFHDA